ncbi:hypothetical protein ACHAW5_002241 [Stephanodiscus triporus]|uniref:Uncharacterized protein n=1 Tax=Stephanodiscus triporus TaxID=2934178 RepID=A0ABD3QQ44_9STRA
MANAQDRVEIIDRKNVEQQLADLVGTFDPAVMAANLITKMWKGLTTILIVMAFPGEEPATNDGIKLPPSILPLDINNFNKTGFTIGHDLLYLRNRAPMSNLTETIQGHHPPAMHLC